MAGLLFPAYQKYYSAITCLERFEKEKNFFDNVSCLDNFFAEYRNITFAIQAALKHTELFSVYEEKRDEYLTDRWFVEKRNETTKQKPFQLVKKIGITIYFPNDSIALRTQSYTVEDDVSMDSLNDDFKRFLKEISLDEVFFSVEFSFFEKETTIDLWEKLIAGISSMQTFMDEMYNVVGEDCPICNQLREKIRSSKSLTVPKDFRLIDDYVYYPAQDTFGRASRVGVMLFLNDDRMATRRSLKNFVQSDFFNYDGSLFGRFVFMHAVLRTLSPGCDIMPAVLIVYNDDTYSMDVFHADIKTTIYRKITEISQMIKNEDIRQVCFMSLYSIVSDAQNASQISKERITASSEDMLVFVSIDQELNEMEYVFDGEGLNNVEYVACVMKHGRKNKLEIGRRNMSPILHAFANKKVKSI